ncbi:MULTISPECIES: CapA family protein [Paracoccus]|uniref:CapA family protein n=1 Tax=Paracoccus litorisediminis TaxID=2006130 RepID=A0A844HVG1_9RHOB|nr:MULTISPECIES: CapA family protein [Paracoccus]MBD9528866.1 CapA family protein [Paracoccus sp. PAR01]MTH61531.1 CapA family protein [Paracoccus litorisediminis]
MTKKGEWRVALAGECMVCRPFAMHDEPEFTGVWELLRDADVTYGHLEMNFADYDELQWPARGQGIGSFMMADPTIAKDLKWAGFDIMSTAHNHSFDFGAEGLLATKRHMKEAGIVTAGTGADLELASEPGYVEKKRGRVALVSTSSGNQHFMWAGLAKGALKGRPGVNPQRLQVEFQVDQQTADNLKAFASSLNITRAPKHGREGSFGFLIPGAQQWGDPESFFVGEKNEIISSCNKRDLARNLRSVDEARSMADLVIVAHHFSVADGPRLDTPPSFVKEFARAVIDGGADIYVGHGWHKTMGIEIYKGKPIIYGIGNFFAQSEFIQRVPYDSYDAWGHDVDRLPTLTPAAHPLHPGLDSPVPTWWGSCVIKLDMKDGELQRIYLHPVEMGRDSTADAPIRRQTGEADHPFTEGRPMLAEGDDAVRILERFKRLSEPFGTPVEIRDGVGVIDLVRKGTGKIELVG